MNITIRPELNIRIKEAQMTDDWCRQQLELAREDKPCALQVEEDKITRHQDRIYIPPSLWKEVFEEAHQTPYAVHLGGTKMDRDLKQSYWWNGIKREIADFVERCLTC